MMTTRMTTNTTATTLTISKLNTGEAKQQKEKQDRNGTGTNGHGFGCGGILYACPNNIPGHEHQHQIKYNDKHNSTRSKFICLRCAFRCSGLDKEGKEHGSGFLFYRNAEPYKNGVIFCTRCPEMNMSSNIVCNKHKKVLINGLISKCELEQGKKNARCFMDSVSKKKEKEKEKERKTKTNEKQNNNQGNQGKNREREEEDKRRKEDTANSNVNKKTLETISKMRLRPMDTPRINIVDDHRDDEKNGNKRGNGNGKEAEVVMVCGGGGTATEEEKSKTCYKNDVGSNAKIDTKSYETFSRLLEQFTKTQTDSNRFALMLMGMILELCKQNGNEIANIVEMKRKEESVKSQNPIPSGADALRFLQVVNAGKIPMARGTVKKQNVQRNVSTISSSKLPGVSSLLSLGRDVGGTQKRKQACGNALDVNDSKNKKKKTEKLISFNDGNNDVRTISHLM